MFMCVYEYNKRYLFIQFKEYIYIVYSYKEKKKIRVNEKSLFFSVYKDDVVC